MTSISNYVSPYNRYTSTKYRININNGYAKIELNIEKKYSKEQIKEINEVINNNINKLDLDKMNDKEKIKWTHDFITKKNEYDYSALKIGDGDAYSAYGAIVGNKAVCLGYAEAMAILLDRFNIPNIMVSNDYHIWNLVNIDDKWLHLDATWDDTAINGKCDYYLVTSDKLSKLDSSDNHKYNYNYYVETLMN
jgi:transglutaminase/protease-like cytokinesis protein 3